MKKVQLSMTEKTEANRIAVERAKAWLKDNQHVPSVCIVLATSGECVSVNRDGIIR